ncbi:MAG: VWD domain-containing protein, partial [Acidimicrobiia bacterium]
MRPKVRDIASLVVVAIVAAACTGSDTEPTTTSVVNEPTSAPAPSAPSALSINDALGGTQTVQDFAIYMDLWKETDDGLQSFYRDVVDRIAGTTVPTVNLAGDMVFTPVDALSGHVVDADGLVVPSLTLDFGLVRPSSSSAEQLRRAVLEASTAAGSVELAQLFGNAGPEGSPLVVEILSADYEESRTHAGRGDRAVIDLTFVDRISPGDELGARYIFGQTLPGDPEVEAEMSNVQLFVYRWNRGLIRVLGDGTPRFVVDDDVRATEGSTLMTREVKGALLFRETLRGWLAGKREGERLAEELSEELENPGSGAVVVGVDLDGDGNNDAVVTPSTNIEDDDSAADDSGSEISVVVHCEPLYCEIGRFDSAEEMIATLAMAYSVQTCLALETFLNEKNASGGQPVEFSDAEGNLPPIESTDSTDPVTGQPDPPPGPVGCEPPPDPPPGLPEFPHVGWARGDIHIDTIDGNRYSNQAAGEFLLFENEATTVQIRTEPWGDSDVVSVATALAFTIGEHMVSVHAGGETRMDGEVVQLERGIPMPIAGGELLWWHGGWVVVWPDGTILRVHERDVALVASVTPSPGPTTGLFGDNDGDSDNDLFTREGQLLDTDADEDFESFYDVYIDSWRITNEESLFNYDE